MVNTLSGSVNAYRKETVKPRFIRIEEVMALFNVTRDEAMDIALAAGARYQLAKIILVHKERLMKFMKHFARVPSSNKFDKDDKKNVIDTKKPLDSIITELDVIQKKSGYVGTSKVFQIER